MTLSQSLLEHTDGITVAARAEGSASDEAPTDRGEPKGRRGGHQ
jgi:hypothetical protein